MEHRLKQKFHELRLENFLEMKNFLVLAGTVLSVKPRFLHEPEKPELSLVDAKKAEIFGPRFEIDDELENIIGKIHTMYIGYNKGNKGFQKCAETFAINEHWYDLNGSQMVYWIRNFAK